MAKIPQSKDEALEALDFIVNVLKEHEKDLDKLINELATVTEQVGNNEGLNDKIEKIEDKINLLQKEVTNLVGYLSITPKQVTTTINKEQMAIPPPSAPVTAISASPTVLLRCQQWEDFQILARNSQTLSFTYKEVEKILIANALRGNQIIEYSGPLPKISLILKAWLSKQLDISDQNILEGVLGIG